MSPEEWLVLARAAEAELMRIPGLLLGTRSRGIQRTLVSGVHISVQPSLWIDRGGDEVDLVGRNIGTIGCFARKTEQENPHEAFLLTAHHVLSRSPPQNPVAGDTVYHSGTMLDTSRSPLIGELRLDNNPIGAVNVAAPFGGSAPDGSGFWLDCALARLAVRICDSSNSNCGVSYRNAFREAPAERPRAIQSVAAEPPAFRDEVWKVGAETGYTRGRVSALDSQFSLPELPSVPAGRCIEVESVDAQPFAMPGDSGSAVLNTAGQIVGIISAGRPHEAPTRVFVCYIGPVIEALGIEILTRENQPTPPAGSTARSDALGRLEADIARRVLALELEFLQSVRGRAYWDLIETHRDEVVRLVNHERRVTVTWHRHQGPAFMNRVVSNARDPELKIPTAIAGVQATELLRAMSAVLKAKGSSSLRRVLEEHEEEVLAHERYLDDLHALARELGKESGRPS